MPNRFYEIERPIKEQKLPKVLSKEEVLTIIDHTNNIKHRCIVSLLYSAGLRRSELINLKIPDIDSKRMLIRVEDAKGNKDRYSLLSNTVLQDLRRYYLQYKPQEYLFEGPHNEKYSSTSIASIIKNAAEKAGIKKNVTPHMLRHSPASAGLLRIYWKTEQICEISRHYWVIIRSKRQKFILMLLRSLSIR